LLDIIISFFVEFGFRLKELKESKKEIDAI